MKLVPFYDRSTLVNVTTATVLHNLIFGCVLIFFIQWIFLGDLRSAIIVGVNIPFALFFSIIILVIRGEDANLLSVGAVDFGIIVDAAVILVENIYRNFQSRPEARQRLLHDLAEERWGPDPTRTPDLLKSSAWTDRLRLMLISALQIDRAVFFSTAIIVAAFIPLFTMQGVEGQIFSPMARTYAYALLGALLATFTVTPCLVLAAASGARQRGRDDRRANATFALYAGAALVAAETQDHDRDRARASSLFSLFLGSRLGSEFLPTLEEGNLWIRASMPPTISLEAGMPIVTRIREILLSHPEVITVTSQHGRPDDGSDPAGFFNAEFFVPLKPFDEWRTGYTKDDLIKDLQAEFNKEFVGVDFNFSQYIQDNVEEGLSGVKGANSVKVIGPDLATLEKIAREILPEMAKVPGVTDLGAFWVLGQPNLNIKVNREKAARYGLSVNDVNTVIQGALGGTTATTLLESDRAIRRRGAARPRISATTSTTWQHQGRISDAERRQCLRSAERACGYFARHRRVLHFPRAQPALRADQIQRARPRPRGRRGGGAAAHCAKREVAERLSLEWAGEFEWLQEAKKRLEIILPITFAMIVVLLYGLFNSWRDSFLALLGLPFAISGGLVALYVSGLDFSISSAIGFISLMGVSVMSGILILNGYYRVASGGMPTIEAMFHAVQEQMRPILMMTLSACIGLLPAAISTGIGSQVQRPLATVIVGGMLIGPIMLLVVVPALQTLFLREQQEPTPEGAPDAPQPAE